MPHKVWASGDEMVAFDVNQYIQQQTVETFLTAADRTASLTTPVKGQCTTRADLPGVIEVYDGSAWVATSQNYTSGTWSTYTPIWRAGGSSAGLTIGTGGSLSASYRMLAPYVMAWSMAFKVGTSGYSGGSGLWDFSLPPGATIAVGTVGATMIQGGTPLIGTANFGSVVGSSTSVATARRTPRGPNFCLYAGFF